MFPHYLLKDKRLYVREQEKEEKKVVRDLLVA